MLCFLYMPYYVFLQWDGPPNTAFSCSWSSSLSNTGIIWVPPVTSIMRPISGERWYEVRPSERRAGVKRLQRHLVAGRCSTPKAPPPSWRNKETGLKARAVLTKDLVYLTWNTSSDSVTVCVFFVLSYFFCQVRLVIQSLCTIDVFAAHWQMHSEQTVVEV